MSIKPASANTSATTRRRRIAAVAATVVLAGSVQLLTAESSWACGAPAGAKVAASSGTEAAPKADAPVHQGGPGVGFHMTPSGLALKAGGPKLELGVGVSNFTGAPYRNVVPSLAVSAGFEGDDDGGVRFLASKYLTVEYRTTGAWQKLPLVRGCDPTLFATPAKGLPVANGRAEHATFRIGLAADAPAGLKTLHVGLSATSEDKRQSDWEQRDVAVTVPKPSKPAPTKPAPAKPTPTKPAPTKPAPAKPAPAKPAAPKPTATATAPAKPANPVSDKTAAAPAAPATPESKPTTPAAKPTAAPVTAAPAGTPELAETGAGTPNGLLAGLAAGLAALGAGMVVAVRRLRAQG
ncbi:hypothetical protein [Kitasatospora putterlickiae]